MKICEGYDILINQYIDGELDPQQEAELREHFESCPACREYYRQLCVVSDAVTEMDFPPGLHGSIMEAVGKERQKGRKVIRFRRPAIAAAAAVLALGLVGIAGIKGGILGPPEKSKETLDEAAGNLLTASADGAMTENEMEIPAYADSVKADRQEPRSYKLQTRMASWLAGGSSEDVSVYNRQPESADVDYDLPLGEPEEGGNFLNQVVETLDEDRNDSYGFCMVASGALEELPEEFSVYAEDAMPGGVVILSVKNDPSVREEIDRSMSENGFKVFYDEDEEYFTVDAEAATGLVIIELDEE